MSPFQPLSRGGNRGRLPSEPVSEAANSSGMQIRDNRFQFEIEFFRFNNTPIHG